MTYEYKNELEISGYLKYFYDLLLLYLGEFMIVLLII